MEKHRSEQPFIEAGVASALAAAAGSLTLWPQVVTAEARLPSLTTMTRESDAGRRLRSPPPLTPALASTHQCAGRHRRRTDESENSHKNIDTLPGALSLFLTARTSTHHT